MYNLNEWDITDDLYGADDVLQNGNRLLTGNGYLGRRGVVDEAEAHDMPATIISGLYDRQGDLWREPVNSPDPLYTIVEIDGMPRRAGDTYMAFHEQALNFRYGIYSRRTKWRITAGSREGTLTVEAERFAHMEDVHLLCMRYTIYADIPCNVIVKQGINRAVRDLNGPHLGNFRSCGPAPAASGAQTILGLFCETLEERIPLAVFSAFVPLTLGDETVAAIPQPQFSVEDDGIFSRHAVKQDRANAFVFFVYGTIYSGPDSAKAAESLILKALDEGWDGLLRRHKAKWDGIWQAGDVVIEGDDYARRCLRYSLYHLWIIAPRHCLPGSRALSIPARGLSGQTYKGAIFWDTEMFIAPYFLAVMPELASQFIRYRIQTLPGAKRKAAEYGYRGAFFAWESQETGDDACSDFNVTDVFTGRPVRTYFRDRQIHISADIV
jgi:trehalose/maltose hydrolase-like predicted phosphorylase